MMRYNKLYLNFGRMLCFLLSFLLSLLIVGVIFISVLRLNSNNSSTIKRVLTSSNYCSNLYQEIESNAKALTISTGLPMEVLAGVFQSDEVHSEVISYVEAIFRDEKYSPDTQKVLERLEQKIKDYLNEKSIRVDTEISQNIDEYTALVTEEYDRSLSLPIIENINRMKIDYRILVIYGLLIGVGIMAALFILSLYDRRDSWYHQFLFYLYSSAFAAAIMLAVIPLILLSKDLYRRLQITPPSLYYLVLDYIKVNLQTLVYYSILLAAISFILLLIERVSGAKFIKYLSCLKRQ